MQNKIEVVIKISEEEYKRLLDKKQRYVSMGKYEVKIANGTPLPPHGELKDVSGLMRGLYEEMCMGDVSYKTSEVYEMLENEAPTILEAKGESE